MNEHITINRLLERGRFNTVFTNKGQISATFNALKKNKPYTYIERHKDGMVVLDRVKKRLTLYRIKND